MLGTIFQTLIKEKIAFFVIAVLIVVLLFLYGPVQAGPSNLIEESTLTSQAVVPSPTNIPPSPTNIPTPTLTPTPVIPTSTPVPQPTSTPHPTATPTSSPTPTVSSEDIALWENLAACESNSNWQANTGNGYYGGLQFSQSAWESVGGAGNPAEASKDEQIERGKLLQAARGWSAWGLCAQKLGLI